MHPTRNPNYVCIRVTDEKLRRLDPPEPLLGGESLRDGEVRFCRDPDGSLSAVTFISQKEPAQCKVAWRDPFTGKASYQHTFQIGYPLMRVSGDGRLCLLDDTREKRAILIDRRDEKVTEIDYSRSELSG